MIRIIRDLIQISATIYEDSLNNYVHSFVCVNAIVFTTINDGLAEELAKKFSYS